MSDDKSSIHRDTERERGLAETKIRLAARPPEEKNRTVDCAAGETQCLAKTKLGPDVVKFCSMIDGHSQVQHVTYAGSTFVTAS